MDTAAVSTASVAISGLQEVSCKACDPASQVEHDVQVTRLRVANLCCAGEEKLIRSTLKKMVGIEHVAVNIVGRYVVVKHCHVQCCSPVELIIKSLNDKHLGVSLQEVNASEEMEESFTEQFLPSGMHVIIVFSLFIAGLALQLSESGSPDHAMWIFLASIIAGVSPLLYQAFVAIYIRHILDIHVLMIIAIIGATASGETFDASIIVTLFLAAELIESIVMYYVRKAVDSSTSSTIPKTATLKDGRAVKIADIKAGDILAVRTGDMILADGIIRSGEAVVNESSLTGESVPISKVVNDTVSSGTVVQNGFVEVETLRSASESTLLLLRQAVLDVQADRGQFAGFVDLFAMYWTPLIILSAALLVSSRGSLGGDWDESLHGGLLLLVLACPCAIVIAAPIPAVCAIAAAARSGVLIRGSSVVERLGVVNTVALDKTGTITKGFFNVTKLIYCDGTGGALMRSRGDGKESDIEDSEDDPLRLAAAVEQKSTHPLANAIVAANLGCIADSVENKNSELPDVRKVTVVEGVGVSGCVEVEDDWKFVFIGNERMFKFQGGGVTLSNAEEEQVKSFLAGDGELEGARLFVAVEDELQLMIELSDEVRPESSEFISTISSRMNLKVTMLTGDSEPVAKAVCAQVGIKEEDCKFRLLPLEKLHWIQQQQHQPLTWSQHQPSLSRGDSGANETENIPRQTNPFDTETDSFHVDAVESDQMPEAAFVTLETQQSEDIIFRSTASPHHMCDTTAASGWKKRVLMVGDGINDSTALAAATVGVAMGAGGSAMAVAAADVVLISDNLMLLPGAIQLCQRARWTIIQNCVFAISVKLVATVLAILGYLDFWHAILVDIGSLLVVVVNGTTILYSTK